MVALLTLFSLTALLAAALADTDASQEVIIECPGGSYVGKVTVTLTYSNDEKYNGKVFYCISDDNCVEGSFPLGGDDNENWCTEITGVNDPTQQVYCESEPTLKDVKDISVKVYVQLNEEQDGDNKKYKVDYSGTNIYLQNVGDLEVVKSANTSVQPAPYFEKPENSWDVISKIYIGYEQNFGGITDLVVGEEGKRSDYCVKTESGYTQNYYPQFEYYKFDTLKLSGVTLGTDSIVASRRAVNNLIFENVTIYGRGDLDMDEQGLYICLYPGIYQGDRNPSVKWEESSIKGTWKFSGVTFKGDYNVSIEGNVGTIEWNNVTAEGQKVVVEVVERYSTTWKEEEVYCPGINCIDDRPEVGNVEKHKFDTVELGNGSFIHIDGYNKEIQAYKLTFNAEYQERHWTIGGKYDDSFNKNYNDSFNVNLANFTDSTIGTAIDYTVKEFLSKSSTFKGEIISASETVDINGGAFNAYVRHSVVSKLSIKGNETGSVSYTGPTYYDHIQAFSTNGEQTTYTHIPYPEVTMDGLTIENDFVVSVDNGKEAFKLSNVSCNYTTKYDIDDPVLLIRHTSKNMVVDGVKKCNILFKNNADNYNASMQNGDKDNLYIYKYENGNNQDNSLSIFDNAAYHVSSEIDISRDQFGENYDLINLRFGRVSIDYEVADDSTDNTSMKEVKRHPPEIDPFFEDRYVYGNSYPVYVNVNNYHIENLMFNSTDIFNLSDPIYGTSEQDPKKARDITAHAGVGYVNDDVNITVTDSELSNTTIYGDSVVFKGTGFTSGNMELKMADSSVIDFKDSHLNEVKVYCYESLDMTVIHSIFSGDGSVIAGDSSHIYMRSILFDNVNAVNLQYRQPEHGFSIAFEGGYAKLENVETGYGHLDVYSQFGDISVVQAFVPWFSTKVSLMSNHGSIDVTHPNKYYRDLSALVDFENESGTSATYESGVSDVFMFEIGTPTTSYTSATDPMSPYTKYITTYYQTDYGKIDWKYADNLDISSVHTAGKEAKLEFKGYDTIFAVSSINAIALEGLFDFKFDSLDYSKTYFVSIRDTIAVQDDIKDTKVTEHKVTGSGGTCTYARDYIDPLDACFAYIILPTIDLSKSASDTKGVTLELEGSEIYLKDCASSLLEKLTIEKAFGVYVANLAVKEVEITTTYNPDMYYNQIVDPEGAMYVWLSTLSTKKLEIYTTEDSMIYSTDYHIALVEMAQLGLVPSFASITSTKGFAEGSVARSVIPVGFKNGSDDISCENIETMRDKTYYYCPLNGTGIVSTKVNFLGPLTESTDPNVNIGVSGTDSNSKLVITYGKFGNKGDLEIGKYDRIVIDNRRFATDFTSFNYPYPMSIPSHNNVYVIPSSSGDKMSYLVSLDTNVDDMLYSMSKTSTNARLHKFNMIEQSQMYLYIPAIDGISLRSAGDNVNFMLSDIGVYSNIFNTSYLIANVLRAEHVRTTFALVYSLEGTGSFLTEVGYVGIDASKNNANIYIQYEEQEGGSGEEDEFGLIFTTYEKMLSPIVSLEKATIDNLGIYTRNYKHIVKCDNVEDQFTDNTTLECPEVAVPCSGTECEIVNYIWSHDVKEFYAGKDYVKAKNRGNIMNVGFTNHVDNRMLSRCDVDYALNDGELFDYKYNCPNSPIYSENVKDMSVISIRGKFNAGNGFVVDSNKNNRGITELNFESALSDTMPTWATVLIILLAITIFVLLVMIALRMFGLDTKFADCCGGGNIGNAGLIN